VDRSKEDGNMQSFVIELLVTARLWKAKDELIVLTDIIYQAFRQEIAFLNFLDSWNSLSNTFFSIFFDLKLF